jgi:hypothetical protein
MQMVMPNIKAERDGYSKDEECIGPTSAWQQSNGGQDLLSASGDLFTVGFRLNLFLGISSMLV